MVWSSQNFPDKQHYACVTDEKHFVEVLKQRGADSQNQMDKRRTFMTVDKKWQGIHYAGGFLCPVCKRQIA